MTGTRGKLAVRLARQVFPRLFAIYGIALGINYVWEMLQMPLYEGMYFSEPASYLLCLKASFGDANIAIAIYLLGSLLFRDWRWSNNMTIAKLAYLSVAGGSTAIVIESLAFDAGWWNYSHLMPLLPLLKVGLVPFLQLILLPYPSYLIAGRIPCLRAATSNYSRR